eukprot:JZ550349.1.p1 GENE.JZ550349.1~~JZ550349.1.p1  ORF type:complete len:129 (+),score=30.35 JZ550349.1:36-422(+)
MATTFGQVTLTALFVTIGVVMNILACVLHNNWRPLAVIATYLLAPLPNLFFGNPNKDDMMGGDEGHDDIGYFLTGILVSSGLAFPIVFLHVGIIELSAMLLSLFGGLITYITLIVFITKSQKDSDSFM